MCTADAVNNAATNIIRASNHLSTAHDYPTPANNHGGSPNNCKPINHVGAALTLSHAVHFPILDNCPQSYYP